MAKNSNSTDLNAVQRFEERDRCTHSQWGLNLRTNEGLKLVDAGQSRIREAEQAAICLATGVGNVSHERLWHIWDWFTIKKQRIMWAGRRSGQNITVTMQTNFVEPRDVIVFEIHRKKCKKLF